MTFGSRTMSAGLPSTSTLPRSSTMARSTSGITISITCSTISTVTPVSRMFRTSSTPRLASDGVSPVITSSSSRSFGAVASARATSRRRFSAGISSLASASARWASPVNSSTSLALLRASPVDVVRTSAPTMTLSITDMVSKLLTTWNVRASPRAQRAVAGHAVTSSPSNRTLPSLGRITPAIRLNKVDLPAPFGPIRPTSSPRSILIEMSRLATSPPNRCVTCCTSSSAVMGGELGGSLPRTVLGGWLPLPLWGRVGRGVLCAHQFATTPLPPRFARRPPPQGGRSRRGTVCCSCPRLRGAAAGEQAQHPLRPRQRHHHHQRAVDDEVDAPSGAADVGARELGQRNEDRGAERGTPQRADAAEHRRQRHQQREAEAHDAVGIDVGDELGVKAAAHRGEERRHGGGRHLRMEHDDAEALGRLRIVFDRAPPIAPFGIFQQEGDQPGDAGEHQGEIDVGQLAARELE